MSDSIAELKAAQEHINRQIVDLEAGHIPAPSEKTLDAPVVAYSPRR